MGLLKISFSTFWLAKQNVLKLILKSPRFVAYGANLIYFGSYAHIAGKICQNLYLG